MSCRAFLLALLAALAVAATPAVAASRETGMELVGGSGRATVSIRGAMLGVIDRGRVAIVALPGRERPEILVQGYEWQRVDGQTTIYGGQGIRFRVFRGAWRVRMVGSGIDASAVGRGFVGLAGQGRYSLAGAADRSWPSSYQIFRLGGPGRRG